MNQPLSVRRRNILFPPPGAPLSKSRRILGYLLGLFMMPLAITIGWLRGTPGIGIRIRAIMLGLRALGAGEARNAFNLVAYPMDSFRYFELEFVREAVPHDITGNYLDVSSPRLVFLTLLDRQKRLVADVINPIQADLEDSIELARTLGLEKRMRPQQVLIEAAGYPEGSFDLITSISVVEHIPDDAEAIATMWRLLRPGGKLVVTVPCARQACEEYTNLDEYGLFQSAEDGLTYWQRYYDEALLERNIWATTGAPVRTRIYGETNAGNYDRNVQAKRCEPDYPYWLEPVMMSREYRFYETIDELPGMGVIGMEFVKPAEDRRG